MDESPIFECEFFGHSGESEDHEIAGYVLHWCEWCGSSFWVKEEDQ